MHRLLLDTNVIIRLFDGRLSPQAQISLRDAACAMVSYTSFWEIAIKSSLGKMSSMLPGLEARLTGKGFELLPIKLEHIMRMHYLPHYHRDPFDRMLIAQAQIDNLTLMTSDRNIGEYDVATIAA